MLWDNVHMLRVLAVISTAIFALSVSAEPAPRVFNQIQVIGNERFRDGDVLATAGLSPNTTIGEQDLRAAVEALELTGEFKDVRITSEGDILTISVDEQPEYTGGLTLGLGYDSDDGALALLGFVLQDLHGPGTEYRGSAFLAQERQSLGLVYRAPNFWGFERSGGIRFGYDRFAYDNDAFEYDVVAISPYHNFRLGESIGAEVRYTLAEDDIDNVRPDASAILQAEAGSRTSSGVGISLITGSDLTGRTGFAGASWSIRFDQDFTGLGGTTNLSVSTFNASGRLPLGGSGFAVRSRLEMGTVVSIGGDGPVAVDRFFLGGASLRGFERGTIGPRDVCLGCGVGGSDQVTSLGGDSFAVLRTDLLIPIFQDRSSVETFIFGDIGSSWSVDTNTAPSGILVDDREFRSSLGVGLSIDTQIGRFESYLALDTNGQTFDEEQTFGITFRSQF